MSERGPYRILAVALSTRGFGYAVMEGQDSLIDYGRKRASGNKNAWCLAQAVQLIAFFKPDVLVLQNMMANNCRRAPRIKVLNQKIIEAAKGRKLKVKLVSTEQVKVAFPSDETGTEYGRARIIAERFPDDLRPRLPPKRRAQDNEDARMDTFDAMALGVTAFSFRNGTLTFNRHSEKSASITGCSRASNSVGRKFLGERAMKRDF